MGHYWKKVIAKFFDNFFVGSAQTCSNYKLDLLFTPAYVPFPSLGARDDRKEKAQSGNEGVEVPTKSFFFFIFCGTKKDWLLFPLQNVDKILLDLRDNESVYGGLKEAHEYYNKKVTKCTL